MTDKTERATVLAWADRAQRMGVEAHRRGDFLAAARLLSTARRYRDLVFRVAA